MTKRIEGRATHRSTRISDKTRGRSSEKIRREKKLRPTSISSSLSAVPSLEPQSPHLWHSDFSLALGDGRRRLFRNFGATAGLLPFVGPFVPPTCPPRSLGGHNTERTRFRQSYRKRS